jgi:leucyl aminopeptidase
MDISFSSFLPSKPGALVVGIAEGGVLTPAAARLDRESDGAISRAVSQVHFSGKAKSFAELIAPTELKSSRIILAGIGKPEGLDAHGAEDLGAAIVKRLLTSEESTVSIAIDLPPVSAKQGSKSRGGKKADVSKANVSGDAGVSGAELAAHIALGAFLQSYRFDHYRTKQENDRPSLKKVNVVTRAGARASKLWSELSAVAQGTMLARDLVNEPPNVLHPTEFAKRAKALTKLGVKVEILSEAQMKKLGMNMLLAVGQGSVQPSQLVVMRWDGAKKTKQAKQGSKSAAPIAFVGKGVCFDSGGLSLKPGASMAGMKGDMGGAAAVVGLMHALATRKASVNAVGVIGLVENMPDGTAMRPDDVVTTMSGQTVEVLNTDAEGRLVLADALWYTQQRFKPRFMINLATLTGAIVVSLGREHAGLFSNNDLLAERITAAGQIEDEKVWRLPVSAAYDRLLKSKIADMKNIGGPGAGSITAAQFLQRFVNNVPWAHLDIAGVAWQDGEQKPKIPSWGTGWGVRVLNRLIADHYER